MIEHLTIYLGRDHQVRYWLKHRDPETLAVVPIPPNFVTRVQLQLQGMRSYCVDTDDPFHPITLLDDARVIGMRLGRAEGLKTGEYKGWLTIFDAQSPNGTPWGQGGEHKDEPTFMIKAVRWPNCG